MTKPSQPFGHISLYSRIGERKYLNSAERRLFYEALQSIENPAERSFCELIYWTGCRPSEALQMSPLHVDLSQNLVVIPSLKKRGDLKGQHFRPMPVPADFIQRLNKTHDIERAQRAGTSSDTTRLWPFARTKGWRLVRRVMDAAGLTGIKSTARGLRHALGVHAAIMHVPETRLQSWLGHASLETTAIYMQTIGPEDRQLAERMWRDA